MKNLFALFLTAVCASSFAATPGSIKWTFDVQGHIYSAPTVSPDGKSVYVGSGDNHLWAIDADGSKKWAYGFNSPVYASPAVSPDSSTIYTTNTVNNISSLYALDASGRLSWKFTDSPGSIIATPVLDAIGNVYADFFRAGGQYSCKVNRSTSENWCTKTGFYSPTTNIEKLLTWQITPDQQGGVLDVPGYTPENNTSTTALVNVSYNGNDRWYSFFFPITASFPSMDLRRPVAYVSTSAGVLYAFDANSSGAGVLPTWTATLGGDLSKGIPAVANNNTRYAGTIYVGSMNGILSAVNPDGTVAWFKHLEEGISSRPAINNLTGVIYVVGSAGTVYALEPNKGDILWQLPAGANTSAVVGIDGTVYVGSANLVVALNG